MNTKATQSTFDVSSLAEQAASQFRGLNPKEPGQWPLLPKAAAANAALTAASQRRRAMASTSLGCRLCMAACSRRRCCRRRQCSNHLRSGHKL